MLLGCKRAPPPYQRAGVQCSAPDKAFVAVTGGGYIQKHAVTAHDFECCAIAGACSTDTFDTAGWRCTIGDDKRAQHPATCVSFEGAQQYCAWIGATLPDEALWLRAVGGTGQAYPWGDVPPTGRANCDDGVCKDPFKQTAPVTALSQHAAENGAVQLAGNVFAWLDTWYASPKGTPADLRAPEKTYRVLKGGSWREHEHAMRNDARHYKRPGEKLGNIGARCARPAQTQH